MVAGYWSTHSLPVSVRAEAARAMLSQVHLPWSLKLGDRDPYACRMDWQDLGGCTLIECRSGPLSGYRDTAEIRRTDGEYVGLLLVLSGRERVRQGELAVALGAGDMLLWDAAAPLGFEVVDPLHKITLLIPRDRLSRAVSADGYSGARRLDGRAGLGALVAGHVTALGRLGHGIPASDAPLAADLVVDLLGRLVTPAPDQPAASGRRGDLVARVLSHIESRLDDPGLSPSGIAAEFGVTPRYLHMVFAGEGETLAAHIRSRRLARIRSDLADPRLDHLSITDIVYRWGFGDSAHASRVFRKACGMSPSQYRVSSR